MTPMENTSIASHTITPKFQEEVSQNKWFVAKVVFNIVTDSVVKNSQFEEQLRLVEAKSTEEAFLKARAIGISEEEIIVQHDGQLIKWEFVDVADLMPLQSFRSGLEIYSQIHETEESQQYIHSIHQRGMKLRMNVQQANA